MEAMADVDNACHSNQELNNAANDSKEEGPASPTPESSSVNGEAAPPPPPPPTTTTRTSSSSRRSLLRQSLGSKYLSNVKMGNEPDHDLDEKANNKRRYNASTLDFDPNLQLVVTIFRHCVLMVDIVTFFIRAVFIYMSAITRLFVSRKRHSIHGEIALVTGAGAGIGRCIALELVKKGVSVVCVDVDETKALETAELIRKTGGAAFSYACDVSDRQAVESMAQRVWEEVGDISILINNAGVRCVKPFVQHTPEQIERTIQVNLLGQIWVLRAFLGRFTALNRGSIVCMGALNAYAGFPHMLPWCASKFAMRGFIEGLHLELRQEFPGHRLHLMTVNPFIVDTGMVQGTIIRIPGLINIVKADKAAQIVVSSIQRRETVVFIPGIYYYIQNAMRILPLRIQMLLTDFIDTSIEINYDNEDSQR